MSGLQVGTAPPFTSTISLREDERVGGRVFSATVGKGGGSAGRPTDMEIPDC